MDQRRTVKKIIVTTLLIGLCLLAIPETQPVLASQNLAVTDGVLFEDGLQPAVIALNGQEYEAEIYLQSGQPLLPVSWLSKLLSLPCRSAENQFCLTLPDGREYTLNWLAKSGSFKDRPSQPLQMVTVQQEVFIPLAVFQELLGFEGSWDPQALAVVISYNLPQTDQTIAATENTVAGKKPASKKTFQPISGIDFKLDSEVHETETNSSFYDYNEDYNENTLEWHSIGTIFGGDLFLEGTITSSDNEQFESYLDKFLWDYHFSEKELLVGSVFLNYPQLINFDSKIIGIEINNSPVRPEPTPAIGSELLGPGKIYYQIDAGNLWRYAESEQGGLFLGSTLDFGLSETVNLGGGGYFLNDSGFQHNIYLLNSLFVPNQNTEIKGSWANSQLVDDLNALDQSGRSWNWGYHWDGDRFDLYIDGYDYGREFYPYNALPLDLTGSHLGFRYSLKEQAYVTGSYHQFSDHSLYNETDYTDSQSLSLGFYERLSTNWDWSTQLTAGRNDELTLTDKSESDTLDALLQFNQRTASNYSFEYFYKFYDSKGTLAEDTSNEQEAGIGLIWDTANSRWVLKPSYLWIDDELGQRDGNRTELYYTHDWAERTFQTKLSLDYYRENGGENRDEQTEAFEMIFRLPKEFRLTLGASQYRLSTDPQDSRDTRYYLCLEGGFGFSGGRTVYGIKPEELRTYGAIVATVFYDNNRNGKRDPDEKTISGIEVNLDGRDPRKTDFNGQAIFKTLRPGIHQVDLNLYTLEIKYTPTTEPQTVDLLPNVISRVELGIIEVGSASGRVMLDQDGDQKLSENDTPLGEATIRIDGANIVKTGLDGSFYLSDLSPGKHQLDLVDLPEGCTCKGVEIEIKAGTELSGIDLIITKNAPSAEK